MDIASLIGESQLVLMNPLLIPMLIMAGSTILSSIPGFMNIGKGKKMQERGEALQAQGWQGMDDVIDTRRKQYNALFRSIGVGGGDNFSSSSGYGFASSQFDLSRASKASGALQDSASRTKSNRTNTQLMSKNVMHHA